jgi:hypothetical protein
MRVQHALRVSGCPGGVAHASRSVLVERFPFEIAIDFGDPFFVWHGILQCRLRHVCRVGEYNVALDR